MLEAQTVVARFHAVVRGEIIPPDPSVGEYFTDAVILEIGYYNKKSRWKRLPFLERKLTEADIDSCREALIDRS